jgi:hypothetical protein
MSNGRCKGSSGTLALAALVRKSKAYDNHQNYQAHKQLVQSEPFLDDPTWLHAYNDSQIVDYCEGQKSRRMRVLHALGFSQYLYTLLSCLLPWLPTG